MKQRGQAASTMDVASGLLDHCRPCSFSDDRHELGDDSSSAVALLDDESPLAGSERFSFRSMPLELFLLLRLIPRGKVSELKATMKARRLTQMRAHNCATRLLLSTGYGI